MDHMVGRTQDLLESAVLLLEIGEHRDSYSLAVGEVDLVCVLADHVSDGEHLPALGVGRLDVES